MRSSRNIISFLSIGIALLMFLPQLAFAGSESNISGWAWSSNIGWISFNSTNTGGSVDYGVNKNADGTLVGYAWSSNIGWIEFGGLSNFPTGSGTTAANAQVQSNGTITGWAKAVAADNNGWDGWISLSGTVSGGSYGVNLSGSNSWAWGGPVIGWVNFNPSLSEVTPTPTTAGPGCSGPSNCGVAFVPPTPGFTLQCDGINLLSAQTVSDTTTRNVAAAPASFTGTIAVSIASPLSLPSGITAQYSFDGGATYSSSPTATINCATTNGGYCIPQPNLSVKLSGQIPADGTTYPMTISSQSSSPALSSSCTINLNALKPGATAPAGGNTQFNEF